MWTSTLEGRKPRPRTGTVGRGSSMQTHPHGSVLSPRRGRTPALRGALPERCPPSPALLSSACPHRRGGWGHGDHSSQCSAGWLLRGETSNVSSSLNTEQPRGTCEASTPAAWGNTRLTQVELGVSGGCPGDLPGWAGGGEGLTQQRHSARGQDSTPSHIVYVPLPSTSWSRP